VNVALLVLLAAAFATGVLGLMAGSAADAWLLVAHGAAAYAILTVLGPKLRVAAASLRRRGPEPSAVVSLLLGGLLLATLGSGSWWVLAGPAAVGPLSLINVHAFLAVALVLVGAGHVIARRFVLRIPVARGRRAFLRLGLASAAGLVAWRLERVGAAALGTRRRRFTGSYETLSFDAAYPSQSWLADAPAPIPPDRFRLVVDGAVARPLSLDLALLRRLSTSSRTEVLDCTAGWYSEQRFEGVGLGALLDAAGIEPGARAVSVESVTGYARRFPIEAARGLLLATAVAGAPVGHGHGAPVRLVAPGHRGYAWVKWVVRIRVVRSSPLAQSPLPLQ
jgi:hypothetical protein